MTLDRLLKLKSSFAEIREGIYEEIKKTYEDASKVFTPASPYGQILTILSAFQENWLFFLEDIANEGDFESALRQESIFGLSSLVGHEPTRSLAASGVVTLIPKVSSEELRGRFVTIPNGSRLRCENNNLQYHLEVDGFSESIKLDLYSSQGYNFRIVQGIIESQSVYATGESMFSVSLFSRRSIDNDRVSVKVNGESWRISESFYDMLRDEKAVVVKTNIEGGISLFFGNGNFGKIPSTGSSITATYVVSEGFSGNIDAISETVSFKFLDDSFSELGETVDLNEVFSVKMNSTISLGSDPEDSEFTKRIAPYSSRSFSLIGPKNYEAFLSRFSFLSTIDAWNTKSDPILDDDSIVYLFLLPKLSLFLSEGEGYFDLPISKFTLERSVIDAILLYIDASQRQAITSEVRYVEPSIKRYVLNVFLRVFDDINEIIIKTSITDAVSDFFLNLSRKTRIPKSDLIRIIEDIEGVDSVNISFLSMENETAISSGFYVKTVRGLDGSNRDETILLSPGQDPKLGLDEFGDISVDKEDLVVIRGGFSDRKGNFYEEKLSNSGFGALNIFIKEKISRNS